MADFQAALRVVEAYLSYVGYRAEATKPGVQDGHDFLAQCQYYYHADVCPHCPEVILRTILSVLESEPERFTEPPRVAAFNWTRADSLLVLQTGGFSAATLESKGVGDEL